MKKALFNFLEESEGDEDTIGQMAPAAVQEIAHKYLQKMLDGIHFVFSLW